MDDLMLIVGGRQLSGWNSIRVTRGVERCPNDFELTMTERYPGELDSFVIKAGDQCALYIGPQDGPSSGFISVIVGYVDRVAMGLSAQDHTITVTGRGKCQDLVDCAAIWPGGQMVHKDALGIAKALAAPYGIDVIGMNLATSPNADSDEFVTPHDSVTRGLLHLVPRFSLMWGETVYETVERVARWSGLLVYEGTDGNLILARTGRRKPQCWLGEGQNIEAASVVYTMDQRYSKYVVRRMGMDVLGDLGNGGDILMEVEDKNVPRPRVRYIIAEQGDAGANVGKQRGTWEMKRRWGRANTIRVTTDNWRGQDGNLWEPNTLVVVNLPSLKVPDPSQVPFWLVSEVTYHLDDKGTHTDLVLMPPEAFTVEPTLPPWEKSFGDV